MKVPRLDTIVNIATLFACVSISAAAIQYVRSPPRTGAAPQVATEPAVRVQPGDKFALPNKMAGKAALVVYLSPTCQFCTESMPFYKRLEEVTDIRSGVVQFIVASSEPERDVLVYLKSHGVAVGLFADATAVGIKTRSTPTLALVKSDGSVRSVWVGRLNGDQEQQVVTALADLARSFGTSPP